MNNERVKVLASDLYDHTFQVLDAEPDVDGKQAGSVADAVQKAFEYACLHSDYNALAGRIIFNAQRDGTIDYRTECLEEHVEIRGNAYASGDDDEDRRAEDAIIADLESGNPWAWCTVWVTCKIPGYDARGDDYLGGCSYASRADFEQKDGCYIDMCDEARHSLQAALAAELEKTAGVVKPS